MKIFLNLSVSKLARVRLIDGDETLAEKTGPHPLPLIDGILTERGLTLKDIEEFDSFPGPGSFTGLKVGAVIANTLNYCLGKEKRVTPVYQAKP
jgi:tRNA A37 threonylcarbamoyladenosine modification protein TsaB